MRISKKKLETIEKRIADLEKWNQDQLELFKQHMNEHEDSVLELKEIINSLKQYYNGTEHVS